LYYLEWINNNGKVYKGWFASSEKEKVDKEIEAIKAIGFKQLLCIKVKDIEVIANA